MLFIQIYKEWIKYILDIDMDKRITLYVSKGLYNV